VLSASEAVATMSVDREPVAESTFKVETSRFMEEAVNASDPLTVKVERVVDDASA
jgi:hypothetical protein